MLTRLPDIRRTPLSSRSGFTLVEMLVVVAIVLIMMSMFASIFSIVTGSLSQQRGIAENDQRGRLLQTTIRGDLDRRTFRDVLPFRANEDTRQLGKSLSRRAGYFEIDEGDPNSDVDDVLQFTTSVNIQLQAKDPSPYIGNVYSTPLGEVTGCTISTTGTVAYLEFSDSGSYLNSISTNSRLWLVTTTSPPSYYPCTVSGFPYLNASNNTQVNLIQPYTSTITGSVIMAENQPDFDDGVWGNSIGSSACAEVSYFLRNGNLYRRILLIRDKQPGADSQPATTTGQLLLWNSAYQTGVDGSSNPVYGAETYPTNIVPTAPLSATPTSSFWNDFDYSAVFYTGDGTSGIGSGVRFHNSNESLNNSNMSVLSLTNPNYMPQTSSYNPSTLPFTLGIPNWRFGHSNSSGLAQDLSSTATLTTGTVVTLGRFLTQECADPTFGYPGYMPYDPTNGTGPINPVDRQDIIVDPTTGMVVEYTAHTNNQYYTSAHSTATNTNRRGVDLLMTNVLTFDVKVWDSVYGGFVDIGSSYTVQPGNFQSPVGGAFSSTAGVMTDTSSLMAGTNPSQASLGNVIGGRLNSTYCGITAGSNGHYRFDTWHPNAYTAGSTLYSEPPYYSSASYYISPSTSITAPYFYNEPPYMPWVLNQNSGLLESAPLTAIQIRINYRDVSSNQVRQMTIVQSLVDRLKSPSVTNEAPEE